jgi:glycosyltransferase involved in cell wall biosynthesis
MGMVKTSKLLKRIKPDIVHAHSVSRYGVYAEMANFHSFVITAWGDDVLIHPKKIAVLRPFIKLALKRADLLTCDGENTKREMIGLGADPQKIRIINFGVDTQKFRPGKKNKKFLESLSIHNFPIVISLRHFRPINNIEAVVRSIPLVLNKVPNARLIIAGRGPEESFLKKLVRSLRVSDSVRFVGFIPPDELPKYLSSSDVYVSTSLSDSGLAASTSEAMACGLPVVTTDVGDNREWVKDGKGGFIIPLRDPESLAEKIIYLLENKHIRMKFGRANRKIIKERNDYRKEMGKMENICEELIRGHTS